MKSLTLYLSVFVVLAVTLLEVESGPHHHNEHCECHYQSTKKGCRIARGSADAGYKCQCRISSYFIWTHCVGSKIQCNTGETCPANCTSQECCIQAGGDCKGY